MDVRKWNPMCSKKVNINLSVKAGMTFVWIAEMMGIYYNKEVQI